MRVYTRTGDTGMTSLYSGERASKASLRVEAYGTMDELQAQLGVARAYIDDADVDETLFHVEELMVSAMAELATIGSEERLGLDDIAWIEERIDRHSPDEFSFRVPGANAPSAQLHLARTVARRCERRIVELKEHDAVNDGLLKFVNRVSDLCYVLACELEEDDGQRWVVEGRQDRRDR